MGKVTFEFDSIEEGDDVRLHANIYALYTAIDETYNHCRTQLKLGDISEETAEHLEKIQKMLWEAYGMCV